MPPSFQLLLAYPPLLATAAALMASVGGDSRAFCAGVPGALVYKVPHRGFPVPWHQDPVVIKRYPAFNVDVYLDDSDEDNACVWAIPGSHLGGYHPPAGGDAKRHVDSWTGGREGKHVPGAVAVRAKRGDVLVHATSVLHGSGWNRSNRMRRTLYYHFDSWEDVNLGGGFASRSDEESAQTHRPTQVHRAQPSCEATWRSHSHYFPLPASRCLAPYPDQSSSLRVRGRADLSGR